MRPLSFDILRDSTKYWLQDVLQVKTHMSGEFQADWTHGVEIVANRTEAEIW